MTKKLIQIIQIASVAIILVVATYLITSAVFKQGRQMNRGLAVIQEMRQLQRLETASYTIEQIIDANTGGSALKQFLFGDKILLIAQGKVIAGVDLASLSEKDLQLQAVKSSQQQEAEPKPRDRQTKILSGDQKLVVTLPATQILVVDLDQEQTRVYDRRQGLLTKGDQDLETQARQEAEAAIRQAACEGGILQQAADNAQQQVKALFKAAGFEKVEVKVRAGEC
jgi:hypothetical protein